MSNLSKIYAIMLTEKLDESDFGDTRVVGFYMTFDKAEDVVVHNSLDLNEGIYQYVIIEECSEGVFQANTERWLYEFDKKNNEYHKIHDPDFLKIFCSLVMG